MWEAQRSPKIVTTCHYGKEPAGSAKIVELPGTVPIGQARSGSREGIVLCMTVTCKGCTKAFEYEHIRGRRRSWCDVCLTIPLNERYGYARQNAVNVVCECGDVFSTKTGRTHCRKCRRERSCAQCQAVFVPDSVQARFCSRTCSGAYFRLPPGEKLRREQNRLNAKNRRRRAQKAGTRTEPYTAEQVAERDEFVCQLCRTGVDMTLSGLDPWGPTIDHVYPLVRGGTDTLDNVQLAHRTCNLSKGDKVLT